MTGDDEQGLWRNPRLKSPANVRTRLAGCRDCQWFHFEEDGLGWCIRPNGPSFDAGDGSDAYMLTFCDRWEQKHDRP